MATQDTLNDSVLAMEEDVHVSEQQQENEVDDDRSSSTSHTNTPTTSPFDKSSPKEKERNKKPVISSKNTTSTHLHQLLPVRFIQLSHSC